MEVIYSDFEKNKTVLVSSVYLHFSYVHSEVCFMMNLLSSPEREKLGFRWCMVVFLYRSIMRCNVGVN